MLYYNQYVVLEPVSRTITTMSYYNQYSMAYYNQYIIR